MRESQQGSVSSGKQVSSNYKERSCSSFANKTRLLSQHFKTALGSSLLDGCLIDLAFATTDVHDEVVLIFLTRK